MQILIVAALISAAVLQMASKSSTTRSAPVLVRSVIDGDTIDVATIGRVRLLGIDAPEVGHRYETAAPFGREARDRLTSLLLHRWVRLEQDGPTLDAYHRHLAYVLTEDGQFVNAILVREGLARVTARLPLTRLEELQRAERDAQAARRGMWGNAPQTPSTREPRPGSRRIPTPRTPTPRIPSSGKRRSSPKKSP